MKSRPCRLSPSTHLLAADAIEGKWGRQLEDKQIILSPDEESLPPELRFAACIKQISEHAPIRILPCEKIVGSATLKLAAQHAVPVYSRKTPGDQLVQAFPSVSHVTPGFDRVLLDGYNGIRARIITQRARLDLTPASIQFLDAMDACICAAETWKTRYVMKLDGLVASTTGVEREDYKILRRTIDHVPEMPANTFKEAVQSLWLAFAFQRLCGNWPAIGRIDAILGPFLRNDLDRGEITRDEARELLAHFWIKGCDWIGTRVSENGSGDAQHYQNIILSGIDSNGNDITNDVTYLVLDVVEELNISDFPIAVRVSDRTPPALWRRIAEVQRLGGGIIAIYNEEQIIASLVKAGYPVSEARTFANDGCWEIKIPGKSAFSYFPIDLLVELQRALGLIKEGTRIKREMHDFEAFDHLFHVFVDNIKDRLAGYYFVSTGFARNGIPNPLMSLLVDDCIEKARGYTNRGARYTIFSPHAGGIQDAANCLHVINKLVFEEQQISLNGLIDIIACNWEGHESLRQHVMQSIKFYGNDDPEADAMARRVLDSFVDAVNELGEDDGVKRPPGVSTFGRQIEWTSHRLATATGNLDGEYLSNNFSPAPGTDKEGPTAVINSHCSLDLDRLTNGTALDLKIDPSCVVGEKGLDVLIWLMKTFVKKGGIFLHMDVVNTETLRDAQINPGNYQNLSVRVAGWSARFVTLGKEWQEMVIQRTMQSK